MAKTKVTKTGAAKTLGKAVIRVTDNSEVTHKNLPVIMTNTKLDKRQEAKGLKRKPQGPAQKQANVILTKKTMMIEPDIPPTEVK